MKQKETRRDEKKINSDYPYKSNKIIRDDDVL